VDGCDTLSDPYRLAILLRFLLLEIAQRQWLIVGCHERRVQILPAVSVFFIVLVLTVETGNNFLNLRKVETKATPGRSG